MRKKILCVDDDSDMLAVYLAILEGRYIVDICADPRTALSLLDATHDLLITDQNMPEMRGDELCRMAREFYPNLPVLIVTGDSRPPAGYPCVRKPFEMNALHRIIQQLLR